jgi:hypothetical protein
MQPKPRSSVSTTVNRTPIAAAVASSEFIMRELPSPTQQITSVPGSASAMPRAAAIS